MKWFLCREENAPLHNINCFLSSNDNICSLISCIGLTGKSPTASHIQVIESFNLLTSINGLCNVGIWKFMIIDLFDAKSFAFSPAFSLFHDMTLLFLILLSFLKWNFYALYKLIKIYTEGSGLLFWDSIYKQSRAILD